MYLIDLLSINVSGKPLGDDQLGGLSELVHLQAVDTVGDNHRFGTCKIGTNRQLVSRDE